MVLWPAASAAAEPFTATVFLAVATAAALGVRALGARMEVPHDDVSFKDSDYDGDRMDPVGSYRRHANDISLTHGTQVSSAERRETSPERREASLVGHCHVARNKWPDKQRGSPATSGCGQRSTLFAARPSRADNSKKSQMLRLAVEPQYVLLGRYVPA
jgi:hypothetical protein